MNFDQILVERNRREQAIRDSVIMTPMSRHTYATITTTEAPIHVDWRLLGIDFRVALNTTC